MGPEEIARRLEAGRKWRYTVTVPEHEAPAGKVNPVTERKRTYTLVITAQNSKTFKYISADKWPPTTADGDTMRTPEPREIDEMRQGYLRYRYFQTIDGWEYQSAAIHELQQES